MNFVGKQVDNRFRSEDTASKQLPNLNFLTDNRKALVDLVGTQTLTQNATLATHYVDSDTKCPS